MISVEVEIGCRTPEIEQASGDVAMQAAVDVISATSDLTPALESRDTPTLITSSISITDVHGLTTITSEDATASSAYHASVVETDGDARDSISNH